MRLDWLEQDAADLPARDDWLSACEAGRLASLPFAQRRADWRLGRWTAKRALAGYLGLGVSVSELARIEIRAAASGAPEAFLDGRAAPAALSISHRAGKGACLVAAPGVAIGCDLEVIEARSATFASDYFNDVEFALAERAGVAERWAMVALLWSAKESVLKALGAGLRMDTRSVTIEPDGDWPACEAAADWRSGRAWHGDHEFQVWCSRSGAAVRTAAIERTGSYPLCAPSMTYQPPAHL